jgi:hypothetical protein
MMFVASAVVSLFLAVTLGLSARAKLLHEPRVVTTITGIGVPLSWFPFLAACELAGSLGLVVGLPIAPVGVIAAIGLVAYFVGALITHVRAGDNAVAAPVSMLVLATLALVLRVASA